MSNIVEVIIKATDNASQVFDNIKGSASAAGDVITTHWKEIAAGAAAAGIAIEAYARSQQSLTEITNKLAYTTGLTSKEVRDLAIDTANVTFPLEDVLKLMEQGTQMGLEGADALQEYANFWDMVGDATGESSVQLGEAGQALRALGISAGNEGEALSAFGYITQNTTMSISDFLGFVQKSGPDLREMGMSVDDTAAILGYLQKELGLSGRVAKTEFSQAVTESGGDLEKMYAILGVSPQKFGEYQKAVSESGNVIKDYAAINNDTYTTLQKLQSMVSETAYKFGDLAGAIEPLAPVMIGIAPGVAIFAQLAPAIKDAGGFMPMLSGGLTGVAGAASGAVTFLLPFLPLIVGIVIAAAALYLAWQTNFLGIREVVAGAKEFIVDRFEGIKSAMAPVADALKTGFEKIKGAAGDLFGKVDELFKKFTGGIGIMDMVGKAFDALGRIMDYIWKLIGEYLVKAIGFAVDALSKLIGFIGKVVDWLSKLADHPVVAALIKLGGVVVDTGAKFFDSLIPPLEKTADKMDDTGKAAGKMGTEVDTAGTKSGGAMTGFAGMTGSAADLIKSLMGDIGDSAGEMAVEVQGAVSKALSDLARVANAAAATKREIQNATSGQLSQAISSGSMSEYDTMNALWQKINVHGDATPAEKAEYERLLAKNRGAAAGTEGLSTASGSYKPGSSSPAPVDTSQAYKIGDSKYNPNPAPNGSSDSTYSVNVHGTGPNGEFAYNIGTAVYSNEGVPIAGQGVQHDGTRVVQYAAKPGYENYTPMLARGGNISEPGRAIVGEEGPELLTLPRGAQVRPLTGGKEDLVDIDKLAGAIARAVGRPITLHIHAGAFVGDKTAARQLVRFLDDVRIMESARTGKRSVS